MTTAICDGMVEKDPKYIEVPSRNAIADQVEITVGGNFFDGMVLLSTCDSIVPGHLMAAARLDIPAIMVTGGYMPHGVCRDARLDALREFLQVDVAGIVLVPRVDDGDAGPLLLLLGVAHAAHEAAPALARLAEFPLTLQFHLKPQTAQT